MNTSNQNHKAALQEIAHQAMLEEGLLPDFSQSALAEVERLTEEGILADASPKDAKAISDLRDLVWASIDNDDSLDLDQLTVAEKTPDGIVKILVAIADVGAAVKDGSAIDEHAQHNTTSVYTAAEIFPMLPEKLSTDLTSLKFNEDRPAIVIEMKLSGDGTLQDSGVYRARVRNKAKLAYNTVGAWLEKRGEMPEAIAAVQGLAENLQMQASAAQGLQQLRHAAGALSLETVEARPVFDGDQIRALEVQQENRAKELIADFMIAANGVTARFLAAHGFPSIRRVVQTPKRWDRIVQIAADHHFKLPQVPDSKALEDFLVEQKAADPLRFPDLSLAVIKLLGSGEYAAEGPEGNAPGHFGLAVKDYAHSTAPNRRYPDLLTQRLLKAALDGNPTPYTMDELNQLAAHCTQAEDAANKVERQVEKSAAALLLESRIGEQFDAIVTGVTDKGTWARLVSEPVEGKLVQGSDGVDVGDKIRVQLVGVDVQKGFIDFKRVNSTKQ